MQLKSLEIHGFKSFGERTKLFFDNGITGIVGPNGCGKSNVVDAIRWVLGEQKTKNLRSEKMENVIFNGTDKRKKSNVCEVSLTFENTRNILPTEYTTVTITRKLYRDGESEYYLNGVTCRLKDINNLLIDTGIGPDSYAIIELKMVEDLLNDKDNSRRNLFEEAAGVSKYKIRKQQTLKKLEDTDQNLSRVDDLLFEIDGNMKSLEKQAKKAEKYFELKAKYKTESARMAILKTRSFKEKFSHLETEDQALAEKIMEAQVAVNSREAIIEALNLQLLDNERTLLDAQKDLNQHVDHIKKVETEKSIRNERLRYLQQRENSIHLQIETEKKQQETYEHELRELEQDIENLTQEVGQKAELDGKLEVENTQFREQLQLKRQQYETAVSNTRAAESEYQKFLKEKEIRFIQISSLRKELERTEQDSQTKTVDLDKFSERLNVLLDEQNKAELESEKLLALKNAQERETEELSQKINETKEEIYKTNRLLDARQNEFNLTKSMVENLEGFPDSVKFLKKELTWAKEAPLLSDIISCDEKYKVALESLLESYMNYYIVYSREEAIAGIRLLSEASKGRANFFILDEINKYVPAETLSFPNTIPALSVIEVPERFSALVSFLLDKVYITDAEINLPEEISNGLTFITTAGNTTRRKFIFGGGSTGLFEGKRLGRARNLEKLEKEIKKIEAQLQVIKAGLEQLQSSLAQVKSQPFGKQLEEQMKVLNNLTREVSILKTKEDEYRNFIAQSGVRKEDISKEAERLEAETEQMMPITEEAEKHYKNLTVAQDSLKSELDALNDTISVFLQKYNAAKIEKVELNNRFQNKVKDKNDRTDRLQKLGDSSGNLKNDLNKTQTEIQDLVHNNMKNDDEIINLYEVKKEKDTRVQSLEETAGEIKVKIHQEEQVIKAERKNKETLDSERALLKEKVTDYRIELSGLKERMQVEFHTDISTLNEEEYFTENTEPVSLEEAETLVKKLREKVQNFGEVNPMAVEAYNEIKERFDFIQSQKNDLLEAKQTLLETIREIDDTAKAKFLDAFTRIRENFIRVFRTLFTEDDACDLILVNIEDPLESEIDIIARPKGKRPLTINQLSGGEKTLTATSLLFAIYLLKPAPFCVFDEVDAPLDDYNIDKFNNIVKEFSSDSQFIIITHNKRTMVSTNVIYGVTMPEKGISKVLPVSLGELNLN